jgi:hypothetical protein
LPQRRATGLRVNTFDCREYIDAASDVWLPLDWLLLTTIGAALRGDATAGCDSHVVIVSHGKEKYLPKSCSTLCSPSYRTRKGNDLPLNGSASWKD